MELLNEGECGDTNMRVAIASTYDVRSGAARAAYRLHQSFKVIGITSRMVVQGKFGDDGSVVALQPKYQKVSRVLRRTLDALPLVCYPKRDRDVFSVQWLPSTILSRVSKIEPGVISLQWICQAHVSIETIGRFSQPVVWTLHDMWPFTGGCHYSQNCERYSGSCGRCPRLGSSRNRDLSHWIWRRKVNSWRDANLTIVTPSHWLADCARASSLFRDRRIEVIPYALDTELYRPGNRRLARETLKLPHDKHLILFGSLDPTRAPRKGFDLLRQALRRLADDGWGDNAELVVFGAAEPRDPPDFGFPAHYLGHLHDEYSLALAYSAAEVMVVPSIQDNLPQTGIEALACGTPVVAFNVAGMRDIVAHERTGYLARPFEIDDLAQGIAWVLADEERRQALSHQARQKAEDEFAQEVVARRYLDLYQELVLGDCRQRIGGS